MTALLFSNLILIQMHIIKNIYIYIIICIYIYKDSKHSYFTHCKTVLSETSKTR